MFSSDILVISYETNMATNKNAQLFKSTLEKNNWSFLFIGEGEKWDGFKNKIIGYYNILKQLDNHKIIVLSDARDVFCLRSPLTFINSIKKITDIDSKIIISSEMFLQGHMDWNDEQVQKSLSRDNKFFWQGIPIDNYWKYHNMEKPLRKFLNSGLIIGKVNNLIKAFEWIMANNINDDQLGFAYYCNTFPDKVLLDFNAEIIHTSTFGVCGGLYDEKQKYDSPSLSELFGLSSYFLHIPGLSGSKGQMFIYNIVSKIFETEIITQTNNLLKIYNVQLNDSLNYSYYCKNDS